MPTTRRKVRRMLSRHLHRHSCFVAYSTAVILLTAVLEAL